MAPMVTVSIMENGDSVNNGDGVNIGNNGDSDNNGDNDDRSIVDNGDPLAIRFRSPLKTMDCKTSSYFCQTLNINMVTHSLEKFAQKFSLSAMS